MVEYTCEKCNKIFYKKSNYKSHLNRKNPCNKNKSNLKSIDEIKELLEKKKCY